MIFKFDGEIKYIVDLDKILQPGTYDKPGQPFDEEFYLILNCAVGGNFIDGPDPWDEWYYPISEFWIDSVKLYAYLGGASPITVECVAKDSASDEDLCNSSRWACFDQDYAPDMEAACDEEWARCCDDRECSHSEVVAAVSDVYEQYDSQIREENSCNFGGTAERIYT